VTTRGLPDAHAGSGARGIVTTLATAGVLAACMLVVLWIRLLPLQPESFAADAREHAADWTYVAEDGREHVYLGDFDSYLWLRHARTLLRTGDACDAVIDGACRDQHTGAPLGATTYYARTLHVAAIAAVHRLVTAWSGPDVPLSVAASLTALLVALAGVLPAFFLARSLGGGNVGGVFAVVLTTLDVRVLARTLGSDNDVWSVVLPLYVLWLVVAALGATRSWVRLTCASAAGGVVGLHAWAWRGWPLVLVIVAVALAAVMVLEALRQALAQRADGGAVRVASGARRSALVLATLVLTAGVATSITPDGGYVRLAREIVATFRARPAATPAEVVSEPSWPSALGAVAELAPLDLAAIARQAGGSGVLVAAWLGILLLLLPQGAWRPRHQVVFGAALSAGAWLVLRGIGGDAAAIPLLGVPILAAALAGIIGRPGDGGDDERDRVARAAGVTLVVWFGAAAYAAHGGLRMYLFAVTPLGIGCGVLAGRVVSALRRAVADEPRWYRTTASAGLALVLTIALVRMLEPGLALASRYRPLIDDAWWDALTHLRTSSAPNAIVHAWWEHGHWITYVADRRVANDGSSLQTHIPYWTARALLAPDDAQSAGVLRMLSCGSDAAPRPEGEQGAYAILRRAGKDPLAALAIVDGLVARDAAAAATYLDEHGLTATQRDAVLHATHCAPPEGYLVVSSDLLAKRSALVAMAAWDPRAPTLAGGAGLAHEDAASGVPFVRRWIDCTPGADGEMLCPVDSTIGGGTTLVDRVAYPASAPGRAVLTTAPAGGGPSVSGSPALVVVAGAERVERIVPAAPAQADLGVLIDVPGHRILVGAPALVGSTLVQLLYLDGRTTGRFEKVDDRTAAGERVTTWRIRWPDADAR
jgi:hypothetical protein